MVRSPLTAQQRAVGKRLGAYLRAARGERKPADVAHAASISPETLRKIETGRLATPAFTTVAALAAVLEIPLDELARLCLAESVREHPATVERTFTMRRAAVAPTRR